MKYKFVRIQVSMGVKPGSCLIALIRPVTEDTESTKNGFEETFPNRKVESIEVLTFDDAPEGIQKTFTDFDDLFDRLSKSDKRVMRGMLATITSEIAVAAFDKGRLEAKV